MGGAIALCLVAASGQGESSSLVIAAAESPPLEVPLIPLEAWPAELSPEDDQLFVANSGARARLLTAIDYSLQYLGTPEAIAAYQSYPVEGITRDLVRRSLVRLRVLLRLSQTPDAFYRAVQREFLLYQATGTDGAGQVHFTGYFEPSFAASRVPTAEYRYPLYNRPADLDQWPLPHPTRLALEGADSPLQGLEIVWLRDRLEAFLIHVQGSARLQMADGTSLSVGYAGRTEYPYTSIGRELINDGKLPALGLTLDKVIAHFQAHPEDLDSYLPRNDRFIFFRETAGGPPLGTFSVPVTAGRSIATDKALMPPGALALITLDWPEEGASDIQPGNPASRYVLNQDTGGAIQGAGRVDIFVGTGAAAGATAGRINTDGALFFLLLRS